MTVAFPSEVASSRRTRATWSLGLSYASAGLSVVQALVSVPLLLTRVPLTIYGAWLAAGSVLSWVEAIEGNLSGVTQQQVSEALGARRSSLGATISNSLTVASAIASVPLCLIPVVSPITSMTHLGKEAADVLGGAVQLGLLGVGLGIASSSARGAILGLQRIVLAGTIELVGQLAGLLATVGGLLMGWGVMAVPTGTVARFGVTLLWSGIWLARRLMGEGRSAGPSLEGMRSIGALTLGAFGARVSSAALERSDAILAATLISPEAAVTLSVTAKLFEMLKMLLGRIAPALAPILSHLHGESGLNASLRMAGRIQGVISTMTSVGVMCAIGLSGEIGRVWVGYIGWGPGRLVVLLGAAGGLWILSASAARFLFSLGKIKEISVASMAEAGVRLPSQAAGALLLGLESFPLASVATNLTVMHVVFQRLGRRSVDCEETLARAWRGGVCRLVVGTTAGALILALWRYGVGEGHPRAAFVVACLLCSLGAGLFVHKDEEATAMIRQVRESLRWRLNVFRARS